MTKPIEEMTADEALAVWDLMRAQVDATEAMIREAESPHAAAFHRGCFARLEFRLFLLAIRAGRFDPEVAQNRPGHPSHPTCTSPDETAKIARVVQARRAEIPSAQQVHDQRVRNLEMPLRPEHGDLTAARHALTLLRALVATEGVTAAEAGPASILAAAVMQNRAVVAAAEIVATSLDAAAHVRSTPRSRVLHRTGWLRRQ